MKKHFANLITFFRRIGLLLGKPAALPSIQCGNINALLLHLCDFDYDLHRWVLRWLAFPLRNPGAKMSTCIVFNGGQGSGKTMFLQGVMAKIYGTAAREIYPEHLKPDSLQWTNGAQFVVINGDYEAAFKAHLKHLITDSAIYARAAYQKTAIAQPNHMNFVFSSGNADFLPGDVGDRRFVVIEVPPPQQPRFYAAAQSEIQNGGIDAFRDYLMRGIDMADFNATTPPPVARLRAVA